ADIVKELGKPIDSLFTPLIEALVPGSVEGPADSRKQGKTAEPETVTDVLAQMEALLGRPADEGPSDNPPQLGHLLRQKSDRLSNEWGQKLAELPVRLIEEPAFRLAGAEEAIRQMVATIEGVLQHHEPLARDLAKKATEAFERLITCTMPSRPGARRP